MANQSGGGSGSGGDQKKKAPAFNEMILGNMKSRSGKETSKWISGLTNENMDDIIASVQEESAPQTALPAQFSHPSIAQTQVKWVDKLFDLFQQYEVDFNRAIPGPDLKVETERAVITPDLIQKMQGSDHYHYSGRLHTRYFTLAIRGNLSSISGYVIPSDHYIGFESNSDAYTRFFEFIPVWDGELKWSIEKSVINFAQLPGIAKLLFGHLIKVAKGEADQQDRFSLSGKPAAGPKPMAESSSFPAALNGNSSTDRLLQHGGVFDDDDTTLPNSSAVGDWKASAPPRQEKASAPPPPERKSESPPQEQPPVPGSTTGSAVAPELTIAQACDLLGRSIGKELDSLSHAGAKAFENHDFQEVERLMKRTAKLKEMRDKMLATITEWKRALDE